MHWHEGEAGGGNPAAKPVDAAPATTVKFAKVGDSLPRAASRGRSCPRRHAPSGPAGLSGSSSSEGRRRSRSAVLLGEEGANEVNTALARDHFTTLATARSSTRRTCPRSAGVAVTWTRTETSKAEGGKRLDHPCRDRSLRRSSARSLSRRRTHRRRPQVHGLQGGQSPRARHPHADGPRHVLDTKTCKLTAAKIEG